MKFIGILIALSAFFITQKWVSWKTRIELIGQHDIPPYLQIAEKAPDFVQDPAMAFHKAQRFFAPWVTGSFAKWIDLPNTNYETLFSCVTGLLFVLTLVPFFLTLKEIKLKKWPFFLCSILLLWNAYLFRYHFFVWGQIPGMLFLAGIATLILGLIRRHFGLVLLGGVLATLGRQTGVLMIPAVSLWFLTDKTQTNNLLKKSAKTILFITAIFASYLWTNQIANLSGANSENSSHMFSLITDFKEFPPNLIVKLFVRVLWPLFIPVVFLTAAGIAIRHEMKSFQTVGREVWLLLFLGVSIVSQPILGGPYHTSDSATRLGLYGVYPIVIAFGFLVQRSDSLFAKAFLNLKLRAGLCIGVLASSLHHVFAWFGPTSDKSFFIFQLLIGISIIGTTLLLIRPTGKT